MRPLPLPAISSSHVFSACVAAITDLELQMRLRAIGPDLALSAENYEVRARSAALDLVPRVTSVGAVSKEELVALYSDHLSATRGAARWMYDQIRNAAPNKKCPLCGVGTVAVLDHHLPKAKYPDLAVAPMNLVPACHFCNDIKRARYPRNSGEQTLHPYYDSGLLTAQWIKAILDPGPPPVVIYSASPPSTWSAVDQARTRRHFTVCGLDTVFTSNANNQLAPLKFRLTHLYAAGGESAVRHYLEEEALGYSQWRNSWQYAMYQALAANHWFVERGFRLIP